MSEDLEIGKRIKKIREGAKLSQRGFAQLMSEGDGAWTQQTVSFTENGKRQLKMAEALHMTRMLGVSILDLAGEEATSERGRPPVPKAEIALAASYCRKALAAGQSPIQIVAWEMKLSTRTAARRIERAREMGLLPPTAPGKASA